MPHTTLARQNGLVLVLSLVILLIVTTLGVSAVQTTTLEEKMAAATRNKDLAFQSAEAALRAAETYLASNTLDSASFSDTCTSGLCTLPTSGVPRWEDSSICSGALWSQCAVNVTTGIDTVHIESTPRYIIEDLKTIDGDTLMASNITEAVPEKPISYYRITAMGYGATSDARVMLQSTYRK